MANRSQSIGVVLSMTDEQRRAQRKSLNCKTLNALAARNSAERLAYFLEETCGQEEAWISVSSENRFEGWYDTGLKQDLVPLWPHKECAASFLTEKGHGWNVIPIPLDDLINVVLPDIDRANYAVAIFPTFSHAPCDAMSCKKLETLWSQNWRSFAKSIP